MSTSRSTLLATFIQLPQEPSSGAARSMQLVCEFLAAAGWQVQVLGTTATEGVVRRDGAEWLHSAGIDVEPLDGPDSSRILRFTRRGVQYLLWDIGAANSAEARLVDGDPFDQLFDRLLLELKPCVLLTYSCWLTDLDRRKRAQASGSRVVFAVHNQAYKHPAAFGNLDACFSPSAFLSDCYETAIGVRPTVLPMPIDPEDVVSDCSDPTFLTFINPEPQKGVAVFARIAEEISKQRPDVPILIVRSRCNEDLLLAIGARAGFDLRRHPNIAVGDAVPEIRRVLGVTRVLLVPSVEEPAGRVAAEALLNGIPVVASDRDGLPETVGGGGFSLALPQGTSKSILVPPSSAEVREWVGLAIRLMTDQTYYETSVVSARAAGRRYCRENVLPLYVRFFQQLRTSGS